MTPDHITTANQWANELHPAAAALTAVRTVGERLRTYTAARPASGRQGIDHLLRTARAVGYVEEADEESYAVLDVLNNDSDVVQDYGIPNAAAWRWWYKRLGLRVAA